MLFRIKRYLYINIFLSLVLFNSKKQNNKRYKGLYIFIYTSRANYFYSQLTIIIVTDAIHMQITTYINVYIFAITKTLVISLFQLIS